MKKRGKSPRLFLAAEGVATPATKSPPLRRAAEGAALPTTRDPPLRGVAEGAALPTTRDPPLRGAAEGAATPAPKIPPLRGAVEDAVTPATTGHPLRGKKGSRGATRVMRKSGSAVEKRERKAKNTGKESSHLQDRAEEYSEGAAEERSADRRRAKEAGQVKGHRWVSSTHLNQGQGMTADDAWRWAGIGSRIRKGEKKSWMTWDGIREDTTSGKKGVAEKDATKTREDVHRTVQQQGKEVGCEKSESGIIRGGLLRRESGNGAIKNDAGEVRKGGGGVRARVE
ncbi:unnamed protein product [Closterium sp. Yama58-4]|nr:unnamed protein product [Closterium sp. Yama58-4]